MSDDKSFEDLFHQGMKTRREVLGDEYVEAAVSATTDFDKDFQEYITNSAWGSVWSRDGLSRRDRSLITVTQLASLHYWDELALHIRAAIRNGVTRDEIKEALLHVAVYAGVPAANSANKIAKRVFREQDLEN
jgi:4-carboxymuconolactone decarboxylase